MVQGQLALQDFNDETVRRDEVRAFAQKVFTLCDDTLPKGAGGVALGCRLRLTTVDGNTFFRSTDVEPGSKTWRLSHQQLADKFVRCASASLTAAQAADVFASALDMAALPTLRSLLAALYPDARN